MFKASHPLLALLGLTLLTAGPALADTTWYQVEVVAFRQDAGDQEQWPQDIDLQYPFNWKQLLTPEQLSARNSMLNQFGEPAQAQTVDIATTPYLKLPTAAQQLGNVAYALKRSNNYSVLFHEAWRMPLTSPKLAPAILISGGNQIDGHYELEGTITLTQSRFIHANANLWLTDFASGGEPASGNWPALPANPSQQGIQDLKWNAASTSAADAWHDTSVIDQEFDTLLNQSYAIKRIVTLKESRRLNSGQMSYLDNPALGIIIMVTPYLRPEPLAVDPVNQPAPANQPSETPAQNQP